MTDPTSDQIDQVLEWVGFERGEPDTFRVSAGQNSPAEQQSQDARAYRAARLGEAHGIGYGASQQCQQGSDEQGGAIAGGLTFNIAQSATRTYEVEWHQVASFDDLVRLLRAMRPRFHVSDGQDEHVKPIAHLLREVK